ncbi:MAG: hypothetical protein ACI9HE_000755, partial [Planctomycetota bacterium]
SSGGSVRRIGSTRGLIEHPSASPRFDDPVT